MTRYYTPPVYPAYLDRDDGVDDGTMVQPAAREVELAVAKGQVDPAKLVKQWVATHDIVLVGDEYLVLKR